MGRALFLMRELLSNHSIPNVAVGLGLRHDLVTIGHEVGVGTLSGVVGGSEVDKRTALNDDLRRTILVSAVHTVDQEVVAIRIAEWLTGSTAVDDEGTLLDLHSSTAAVIVAVVDGHSSALPDIDAIAAVDAGINAAVLTGVDGEYPHR